MKICIITIFGKFSARLNYHTTVDVGRLSEMIKSYGIDVYTRELNNCVKNGFDPYTTHIVIGGHPNRELHAYLLDFLYSIINQRLVAFPSIDLAFCYENKGLQGLLAIKHDLPFLEQDYHYSFNNIEINQKKVFKRIVGAGSSNVAIAKSEGDLLKNYKKEIILDSSLRDLAVFVKFYLAKKLGIRGASERYPIKRIYRRFVLQEFAQGLTYDYKVLVFYDRVYVLKRYVRKGDFRSSGSGNFEFEDVPPQLLDFSLEFLKKIDSPYIAMDVLEKDGKYSVIEFQGVHFGPYTQMKAPFYYSLGNDGWKKLDNNVSLEESYAYAICMKAKEKAKHKI